MTNPQTQAQPAPEQKPSDKELNFRALEQKYQAQLQQERQARLEAEQKAQEALARKQPLDDDEDNDDEPYVDKRKLKKQLAKFGEKNKQETQSEIQRAVQTAIQEERKKSWINQNSDFYEVLQNHAETFAQKDPELAETILSMPEGFERQKLVYKSIKAMGLDKPAPKQPSIQEKVDANRRSPYYQPSGVGSAPYSSQSDFSQAGQKEAYAKMQDLKARLRI